MRFFEKLVTRLKGPATPASADFAIAIDTLAAQVIAHHRLIGLLLGHAVALTPAEKRRDFVNLLYSGISHPNANAHHGLSGTPFNEIGRAADEISNNLIDAIAVGNAPSKAGNAPPGT